jgi:beta-fructofuranosidase
VKDEPATAPTPPSAAADPRTVRLHHAPGQGRFGDPSPLVWDGRHHVFFQNSPRPDDFTAMRWAHAVSDDLLRWRTLPDALTPDPEGPDAYGCWTGCVIRDGGRFHAFYTGIGAPDGRRQTVCRAESDDLMSWRKDPGNPVLGPQLPFATDASAAWRDPQVRALPEGGFEMVLTADLADAPHALRGCVARFTSDDLRTWHGPHLLYHPGDVHRCECPEVVPADGRYALLYSDYGVQVRLADSPAGPWRTPSAPRLDDFRYYAAKTAMMGDRRLVYGFVFDRHVPDAPLSPPHDGSPWTWGGVMAFPRELVVTPDHGVGLRPAREVDLLRRERLPIDHIPRLASGRWVFCDGELQGTVARDGPDLAVALMGRIVAQSEIAFTLRWGPGGRVGVLLHVDDRLSRGYLLELDRARRDLTWRRLLPHSNPASPVLQRLALPDDLDDTVGLRLLLDGTLLEAFVADRVAFSARLYDPAAAPWWGLATRDEIWVTRPAAWQLGLPHDDGRPEARSP